MFDLVKVLDAAKAFETRFSALEQFLQSLAAMVQAVSHSVESLHAKVDNLPANVAGSVSALNPSNVAGVAGTVEKTVTAVSNVTGEVVNLGEELAGIFAKPSAINVPAGEVAPPTHG